MDQLRLLLEKFDALSIRERGLVLVCSIFMLFFLWNEYLIDPQVAEEKQVLAELEARRAEQAGLNVRLQQALARNQTDPDAANRERLADLRKQLAEIETQIRQSTDHLIEPAAMPTVLQAILDKSAKLVLTEVKGTGALPLLAVAPADNEVGGPDQAPAEQASGSLDNAYKHGLVLTFEGDYLSTLEYVRALESLDWGFFWESIDFEVLDYPRGKVTLTLYTLSLDKDWIGV